MTPPKSIQAAGQVISLLNVMLAFGSVMQKTGDFRFQVKNNKGAIFSGAVKIPLPDATSIRIGKKIIAMLEEETEDLAVQARQLLSATVDVQTGGGQSVPPAVAVPE